MQKKLNQNFSFNFTGTIWNMLLDEVGEVLVLEIRDINNHFVEFAAIDLKQKILLWKNLKFDEDWWIGMAAIRKGLLFLYLYENDQNPVPSSYILYSVLDQSVLWEISDFKFLNFTDEGIIGYSGSEIPEHLVSIDPFTGLKKNFVSNDFIPIFSGAKNNQENKISYFPFHYLEETDHFSHVKNYLYQNHGISPIRAIDYLEIECAIIISYYVYKNYQNDNMFDQYILILNRRGEQLLKEKIHENLTGIGLGTFFVVKDQLIIKKNKSEINSYQIDL